MNILKILQNKKAPRGSGLYFLFFLCLAAWCTPKIALAQDSSLKTLTLRDKSQLTGEILSTNKKSYTFLYLGDTLEIPVDHVERVHDNHLTKVRNSVLPTGFTLDKGEGYYSTWNGLIHQLDYGINKNWNAFFSLGYFVPTQLAVGSGIKWSPMPTKIFKPFAGVGLYVHTELDPPVLAQTLFSPFVGFSIGSSKLFTTLAFTQMYDLKPIDQDISFSLIQQSMYVGIGNRNALLIDFIYSLGFEEGYRSQILFKHNHRKSEFGFGLHLRCVYQSDSFFPSDSSPITKELNFMPVFQYSRYF